MDDNKQREEELSYAERLGRLRQAMYSRSISPHIKTRPRREIKPVDYGVPTTWEEKEETTPKSTIAPRVMAVMQKSMWWVLFGAVAFFVMSTGIFFYYFTIGPGGTVASPGNIEVTVRGPSTVIGGEKSQLQVVVTNHNQATLELADLIVRYPDGTRSPIDFITALPLQRISLGSIEPGGRRQGTVSAVLIGKEGAHENINIEVEYRVSNSNAIFVSETDYAFTFATTPISVALQANSEAISGQSMLLTIHVMSDATTVLKDVLLTMEYPFGFRVESRNPEPRLKDTWELSDLRPGEEHTIVIRGVLDGQDSDDKVFRAYVGTRKEEKNRSIDVVLSESVHHVAIARPFIGLGLAVDRTGGTEAVTVSAGETINISVPWVNNLTVPISNAIIVARLSGLPINRTSVRTADGFYRSTDNTILWDKTTTRGALDIMEPGENGSVSFSFQMPEDVDLEDVREAAVEIAIHAAGKRASEAGVPETLQASVTRTLKLASNTTLQARGFYYSNPFGSVGPLPPKVDQETTYAVLLTLKNSSNKLKDAKVKAELPPYVRWIGVYSPAQEAITFNSLDGTIEWRIGDVAQGVGFKSGNPREVAFLIGITPSQSQVGQQPIMVRNISFTGTDTFTEAGLTISTPNVNTNLTSDPGFSALEANVVQ